MPPSPRAEPRRAVEAAEDLDADLLRSWSLPVESDGDKYSRGTVLVIGGSAMTPGAVLLAGRAALWMGAGRLQIATVRDIAIPVGVALPEAMVLPFDTVPTTGYASRSAWQTPSSWAPASSAMTSQRL